MATVLVRVLQGSGTNRMCMYMYVCICIHTYTHMCVCVYIERQRREERDIYYKKLAHIMMEAGQSQDVQDELASWRPGTAVV